MFGGIQNKEFMSIRIRRVKDEHGNPHLLALCAARSIPQEGDIYLDDGAHHVLGKKFARDTHEMYKIELPYFDDELELVEREESNNPNRDWWDTMYGHTRTNGKSEI